MTMTTTKTLSLAVLLSALGLATACVGQPSEADDLDERDDTDVGESESGLTTRSIVASADAYVDSSRPSTNFGSASTLQTDTWPTTYRSYLKFDVPAVNGTIKKARLRLYVTDETPDGPELYGTTTTWSESTITYANAPAHSGKLGDLGSISRNTFVEYDVTAKVKAQGSYGFALVGVSGDGADFSSRTGGNAPTLILEVEDPPPPAPVGIACPSNFKQEVFRDDFNGSAVDTAKWQIVDQGTGGGAFTQLTHMRRENVKVSGGLLRVASMRHCENPRTNRNAAENTARCAGQNFYSGGWLKAVNGYAPTKGLMVFLAKMPSAAPGYFPALWARNTEGGLLYTEFDLIEMTYDNPKGKLVDPNKFQVTSWFDNASIKTTQGFVGPYPNLAGGFRVWEVEWDATAATPIARYYYRDAPGATRQFVRDVTANTPGWAGKVDPEDFRAGVSRGFKPYIDFAVAPDTYWSSSPDAAAVYNPSDLLVDSVIVCKP